MTDAIPPEREKRSGVIIRAAIDLGSRRVERRVRNLSLSGACIDQEGELTAGQHIRLSMGRLDDLTAEVMWVKDRLAGLKFDRPIDLEAARASRGAGLAKAGWMTDINHAYRVRR